MLINSAKKTAGFDKGRNGGTVKGRKSEQLPYRWKMCLFSRSYKGEGEGKPEILWQNCLLVTLPRVVVLLGSQHYSLRKCFPMTTSPADVSGIV